MFLFNRTAALTVNGKQFSEMRLSFDVMKDQYGKGPNTATIKVYNLSRDSRDFLESSTQHKAVLSAGYDGENSVLFIGDISQAFSERNDADITTTLVCMAGLGVAQRAHLEFSGIQTDWALVQAILAKLKPLGVAQGPIPASVVLAMQSNVHKRPLVGSGPITNAISEACFKGGFRWSIDNGALHFYAADSYLDDQDVVLSQDTGMVGVPSKAQVGGKKEAAQAGAPGMTAATPMWKVRSLLNPLLVPRRKVIIHTDSLKLPAELAVWKASHKGDTLTSDWFSDLEMGKLGSTPYSGPVEDNPEEGAGEEVAE